MITLDLGRRKKNCFTLIELVAVTAVAMLILGIATFSAGKIPAFITLENTANNIQFLLIEAENRALLRGEEIVVDYNSDDRKLSITGETGEESYDTIHSSKNESDTYKIPEKINVEFPSLIIYDEIKYYFFPGGTASGPEMLLSYKGHSVILEVSPLTGITRIKENE